MFFLRINKHYLKTTNIQINLDVLHIDTHLQTDLPAGEQVLFLYEPTRKILMIFQIIFFSPKKIIE